MRVNLGRRIATLEAAKGGDDRAFGFAIRLPENLMRNDAQRHAAIAEVLGPDQKRAALVVVVVSARGEHADAALVSKWKANGGR